MSGQTPSDDEILQEALRQQRNSPPIEFNTVFQTQPICTGTPVPAGWIVTDDYWSPSSCGNPTTIEYNMQTITQYSDRPVGDTLPVCAYAPTPDGWVEVDSHWAPGSCGHPSNIVNNVKVIKRLA